MKVSNFTMKIILVIASLLCGFIIGDSHLIVSEDCSIDNNKDNIYLRITEGQKVMGLAIYDFRRMLDGFYNRDSLKSMFYIDSLIQEYKNSNKGD